MPMRRSAFRLRLLLGKQRAGLFGSLSCVGCAAEEPVRMLDTGRYYAAGLASMPVRLLRPLKGLPEVAFHGLTVAAQFGHPPRQSVGAFVHPISPPAGRFRAPLQSQLHPNANCVAGSLWRQEPPFENVFALGVTIRRGHRRVAGCPRVVPLSRSYGHCGRSRWSVSATSKATSPQLRIDCAARSRTAAAARRASATLRRFSSTARRTCRACLRVRQVRSSVWSRSRSMRIRSRRARCATSSAQRYSSPSIGRCPSAAALLGEVRTLWRNKVVAVIATLGGGTAAQGSVKGCLSRRF